MNEFVTFHKVLDYLQYFQEQSPLLNTFGYGNLVDFGKNISGSTVNYPFLFAVPQAIEYQENMTVYNLTLIFADILNWDLSNEKDCVSDMSWEAKRFLSYLKYGQNTLPELYNNIDIEFPVNAIPFFERFGDHVAGVAMEVPLIVYDTLDACDYYPTPTPSASQTTPTVTPTNTVTPTVTPTITSSPTVTPSPTSTSGPGITPTTTSTSTPTPSITPSLNCIQYTISNSGTLSVNYIDCQTLQPFSQTGLTGASYNICAVEGTMNVTGGTIISSGTCPTFLSFVVSSGTTKYDACNNYSSGITFTVYAQEYLSNCSGCVGLTCWACLSTSQTVYSDINLTTPVGNAFYTNLMAPSQFGTWAIIGGAPQSGGFFGGCP